MPYLTSSQTECLKWLALITMIIDHIGVAFSNAYPALSWCRVIGRFSYVAFGFIIALNLSRDKVNFKSYFTWMIATAFLSEISFTLFEPNYDRLNVLFQFLSVIGVIWVYKNRQDLNSWVMFLDWAFLLFFPHSLIMVYLGFYIALVVTYSCKQKILNFVLLRC